MRDEDIKIPEYIYDIIYNYLNSEDFARISLLGINEEEIEIFLEDEEVLKTGFIGFCIEGMTGFNKWERLYIYLIPLFYLKEEYVYSEVTLKNVVYQLYKKEDYDKSKNLYFNKYNFPMYSDVVLYDANVIINSAPDRNYEFTFNQSNIYIKYDCDVDEARHWLSYRGNNFNFDTIIYPILFNYELIDLVHLNVSIRKLYSFLVSNELEYKLIKIKVYFNFQNTKTGNAEIFGLIKGHYDFLEKFLMDEDKNLFKQCEFILISETKCIDAEIAIVLHKLSKYYKEAYIE